MGTSIKGTTTPAAPIGLTPADTPASKAVAQTAPLHAVSFTDGIDAAKPKQKTDGSKLQAPRFAGIREAFPIADLSQIDGKGKVGDKFMLDGGSLQGLQLQVRRVVDGNKPGFEVFFKVNSARLPALLEAMGAAGATNKAFNYQETVVGDDGVVRYGKGVAAVTAGFSHKAPNTSSDPNKWAKALALPNGSSVEVVSADAAKAIRGQVRVQLRGSDAECTKQLQGLVKQLSIEELFAPPTEKTFERLMLMRLLWQHDHAAAEALAANLDAVTPAELREKLKAVGFSDERLAGIHYKEVFPGHFTAIDPQQALDMQAAGARYLYSTVTNPEHVLSILQHGQQSSARRFQEGLIVSGMSSNADFSSGGAVGVFTRLVTQHAIDKGSAWAGRTYKVILKPEILARSDYFGWSGDFYGRSWELSNEKNFGTKLVDLIDGKKNGVPGSYATTNELIFRTGNAPEYIAYIVATTASARDALITLLKERGYVHPSGMTPEELVRLEPKMFAFTAKVEDPKQFFAQALAQATAGNVAALLHVLTNPTAFAADGLRVTPVQLRDVVHALALAKNKPALDELVKQAPSELIATDDEVVLGELQARNKGAPPALSSSQWAQVLHALFSKNDGKPQSKMQQWAVAHGLPKLVENGIAPALPLLQSFTLLSLDEATLTKLVKSLGKKADAAAIPWQLRALVAQAKQPSELDGLVSALLERDTPQAHLLLGDVLQRMAGWLSPGHEAMAATLTEIRDKTGLSVTREIPELASAFAGDLGNPLLKVALPAHADKLRYSQFGQPGDLRALLRQVPLYSFTDQEAFVSETLGLADTSERMLRIGWLLSDPASTKVDVEAAVAQISAKLKLSDESNPVKASLKWLQDGGGDLPGGDLSEAFLESFLNVAPPKQTVGKWFKSLFSGKDTTLTDNQREFFELYAPTVLASTSPALIAFWRKQYTSGAWTPSLYSDLIPAMKALIPQNTEASIAAYTNLAYVVGEKLANAPTPELTTALAGIGVYPPNLGMNGEQRAKAIQLYTAQAAWSPGAEHPVLDYLLVGASDDELRALLASVGGWPKPQQADFLRHFVGIAPAAVKLESLRLLKKLGA